MRAHLMTGTASPLEGFLTKSELATAWNVSERSIDRYVNQPDGLPFVRLGGRRLFPVEMCRNWLLARVEQRNPLA